MSGKELDGVAGAMVDFVQVVALVHVGAQCQPAGCQQPEHAQQGEQQGTLDGLALREHAGSALAHHVAQTANGADEQPGTFELAAQAMDVDLGGVR